MFDKWQNAQRREIFRQSRRFSLPYSVYDKESQHRVAGKDPLFGYFGIFQIRPKSARAIHERFFATARRDFAGIIVLISRNRNAVVAKKIRRAPQVHLISASLNREDCAAFCVSDFASLGQSSAAHASRKMFFPEM